MEADLASVCTLGGVLFIGGIFMATKEFKTIEEQMDLLVSRGLSIPDRKKAAEFLYENNYYRVSGYSLTLRKHDRFYPSVSVQNIIDIYEFDYHFRHILLKYLDNIHILWRHHPRATKGGAILWVVCWVHGNAPHTTGPERMLRASCVLELSFLIIS